MMKLLSNQTQEEPAKSMAPPPLAAAVVTSTIWLLATRWGMRLLGLINLAILGRLLDPEDFGISAMAFSIMEIGSVLVSLGAESAVIQFGSEGKKLVDT